MLLSDKVSIIIIKNQPVKKTASATSISYQIPYINDKGRVTIYFKQLSKYNIKKYFKSNNIYDECISRD